jgi:hypothetical protein
MGENKDYSKIDVPADKEVDPIHHVHKFESDGGKCIICGKTIEELLAD